MSSSVLVANWRLAAKFATQPISRTFADAKQKGTAGFASNESSSLIGNNVPTDIKKMSIVNCRLH